MAKTGEVAESEMEDLVSTPRHTIDKPEAQVVVTVSAGQLHLAVQEPNRGRPA